MARQRTVETVVFCSLAFMRVEATFASDEQSVSGASEVWVCETSARNVPHYTNTPTRQNASLCHPSTIERAAFNKLPDFPVPTLTPELEAKLAEQERERERIAQLQHNSESRQRRVETKSEASEERQPKRSRKVIR